MPFQSFQSGCGTCNASTDYADIYYSQDANLASSSVPPGPGQTGAGKKKRSTKKRSTSTKVKKSTTTKKVSKKKSVGKKKRTMRGGASESFQLDDQFIRDNLGISFETVGGATYMPPEFYKGGMLDSLRTGTMAGYDANEHKYATVGGAKKKRVTKKKTTSKKSVKKVTKKKSVKKSTKKVSKKKTTKKVESSWKFW